MQRIFVRAQIAAGRVGNRLARFTADQNGQGTVEYVGLILLVALLMVGMVAAMQGFQGRQGLELASTIVDKIRGAVCKVTFR
ncbi:MAG: Flp family type IVb pilin [bacterium]